jgi:cholest-4-en-3-one 26-monooxygenase
MAAEALTLDAIDIISPERYATRGYPHEEWALLRREAPVFWYERPDVEPFWAITRHADLTSVARQPRTFGNGPRLAVIPNQYGQPVPFRHLLGMDPPDHARYRNVVSAEFTPKGIARLAGTVEAITQAILDDVADRSTCDFVLDVAARLPMAVIAAKLGVPREDWQLLFGWTNRIVGAGDPEFQDGSAQETRDRVRGELFLYFGALAEKRRAEPRDDLVSTIANARLDGEPLPVVDQLIYFYLLLVTGNETTRNATTGGLLALMQHPDEWRKLRRDPSLVPLAVEEIVRWTSPAIQFCRTAREDAEVRGQRIRAGESLCLFYPSASRDEAVFEDPFRFRVDRDPNPHLSYGIGEHFCLGAELARLELRVMFRQLVQRLDAVELAGPVEWLCSNLVGGVKHMPIRYTLRRGPREPRGAARAVSPIA